MRKVMSLILLFISIFSLSSCGIFKELMAETEKAKEYAIDFCDALSHDNLELANTFIHFDSPINKTGLDKYITTLESDNNVDFSNKVNLIICNDFESTYYTSEYNGSSFEFTFSSTIGSYRTYIYFVIINNDNGYGIYDFGFIK